MKKFYFLLMIIMVFSTALFAQRQGLSLGGNVHFPIGEFSDLANTGYGGSVTYEHPLATEVLGIFYTGYSVFDGKIEGSDWSMVPLLGGVKGYLSYSQDWYFTALLGVNFITANYSGLILGDRSESSTEFQMNANFGYEIQTAPSGALDISAGYVYINELSYIGVRLAYIFKL